MKKRRGATRTSSYGSAGRSSHDSSPFYAGKLYLGLSAADEALSGAPNIDSPDAIDPEVPPSSADPATGSAANGASRGARRTRSGAPRQSRSTPASAAGAVDIDENPLPLEACNTIFCASAESMAALPDRSVHLMVTSPPYNVGKVYDADLTLDEYLAFLQRVWSEVHRVLVPGGRLCVNIANLGRKPYIPLHLYIARGMLDLGFQMRGEVIWDKGASAAASTAWGSWRSPANPTLRDVHEYILIFSKGSFRRSRAPGRLGTIERDEFLQSTKSVWSFAAASARKLGHPAPFPLELPRRLIQLYTFSDEVVLDPFMGSGQTALAALQSGRRYVGYELDPEYVRLAQGRLAAAASEENGRE